MSYKQKYEKWCTDPYFDEETKTELKAIGEDEAALCLNEKGIAFYNHLIDELLANDIEPYITMYHWELPYELYKRGGWMNPQIVEWFGAYAKLLAERFSDRVTHFFTMNEPQCFVGLGFVSGEHAPGLKSPLKDTFQMAHNAMKAHGRAVQMLRAHAKQSLMIGYAPTGSMRYPETEKPEDIEAARQDLFALTDDLSNWHWNVSWWSDPVLLGKYPEEGLEKYAGFPKTAMDWPVTPESLYWGPKFLYERYKKPIYITENGLSCHDVISLDGKVHDPNRIDFLARYLHELKRAANEIDLRGYFQWSLMDNFEWAKGYSDRFGLVYVDYQTQKRVLKDSAYWYQQVIKENGENI